jgi:hypothetical protein
VPTFLSYRWFSSGADGPCSPTTGICRTKPMERSSDSRFNLHQIRWAYWIVKQNAVKVRHATTGYEFFALVPFINYIRKSHTAGGTLTFDRNGLVNLRVNSHLPNTFVTFSTGNFTDSEYFMRYFDVPSGMNDYNDIKLKLPGSIPKGSKFHYCVKGNEKERDSDECKGSFRSDSMFWKSKVLTDWRNAMNLPPRLQELRMWATRLHLYGGHEEMKLLNTANQIIAGLPIPVDQMSAEEQLMMLGLVTSSKEAALVVHGSNEGPNLPHLYTAPDPDEDPEALRAMENLAYFAAQAEIVLHSGADQLNVTKAVLEHIRNFFMHGVLPYAGLDELDEFLLKKIGMLSHCGFASDMKVTHKNISGELFCAMRVHLMNESEMQIFCPSDVKVWQENCLDVEFLNFTAISELNEKAVINSLRHSFFSALSNYPTSYDDDQQKYESLRNADTIYAKILLLRMREKELLLSAMQYLDEYESMVNNGSVLYQLEMKAREREELNRRKAEFEEFTRLSREIASQNVHVASIVVNTGNEDVPKLNLTVNEGESLAQKVVQFCNEYGFASSNINRIEDALRKSIQNPKPLLLHMGVALPSGLRKIVGIPEGSNVTLETAVFCSRYNISYGKHCLNLEHRIQNRLQGSFYREVLTSVSIESVDGRNLKILVREGEQHDLLQHVTDFFQYYNLPTTSVNEVATAISNNLPKVALIIPINMQSTRAIQCAIFIGANITNTIEGFANFYDIQSEAKTEIFRRAVYGMAPGTYLL